MEKIIATMSNIEQVKTLLIGRPEYGLDTETYGVRYEDRMFSAQISCASGAVYFNFKDYADDTPVVTEDLFLSILKWIDEYGSESNGPIFYIHNAKFDLHRIPYEIKSRIWCTAQMERLLKNNYDSYSLDECLKRRDRAKDDTVKAYIDEHKLYTNVKIDGKETKEKRLHYDKVPASIIIPYGFNDVIDCLYLGKDQRARLEMNSTPLELINNELALTKAVWRMEQRGIKADLDYCKKAQVYEENTVASCKSDIESMTGKEYESGPLWLKQTLVDMNVPFKTDPDTGNPIFDKYALMDINSPLTNKILEMREHEKNASAFYSTIRHLADSSSTIHPNFLLYGTDTARFSCTNPNIQQMPKEDELEERIPFYVRGSFRPREDHILVMMDYDQMEYRLLADYAGEIKLIKDILGGLDPHQAVANMVGITRKQAKTLNFGLLYGMGIAKLAKALKISEPEAKKMKSEYFSALPRIRHLSYQVQEAAKTRGYIINKFGRRYYLSDPTKAYKMLNHLIQGTGAEVVRHAIPRIDNLLQGKKSGLVIQVHDELVFEIHKDELDLLEPIRKIMEDTYKPFNGMFLTCGIEYSTKSWGYLDKIEGIPTKENWNE